MHKGLEQTAGRIYSSDEQIAVSRLIAAVLSFWYANKMIIML